MTDKSKCTLTNEELIAKATEWVYSLAKSGGDSWTLSVPVNFNKDPDILFMELCSRLDAKATAPSTTEEAELSIWSTSKEDDLWKDLFHDVLNGMMPTEELQKKYSITRKQEVPEAVSFAEWCVEFYGWSDTDELWVDNQEKKYSTAELFQLFKTPTNAPAQTH